MAMAISEIEALIKAALPDARVTIEDLAGDGDHYAPGSSPFALVVQRPASWLDQGQSELLAGGSAWTRPSASAPPGAAHADVLGSFPGAGPGTLLVGGSTKAGKPALWRVTFSSGALSWSPLRLVVPKTAMASNLEGAGS
jgi:hypothetical protein